MSSSLTSGTTRFQHESRFSRFEHPFAWRLVTATMTARQSEFPDWLDLKFDRGALKSEQAAHAAATRARDAMFEALRPFGAEGTRLTKEHMFLLSASNRAFALHEAVVREADHDNPHAAFTLLRAMLDLVLVLLEVRRNPGYASVVMDVTGPNRTARGPLKSQKLLARARQELPNLKGVWDDLSEVAHFGREGFLQTIKSATEADGALRVSVSTEAGFREPDDKAVAIVGAAVMSEMVAATFRKILADRPPGAPTSD